MPVIIFQYSTIEQEKTTFNCTVHICIIGIYNIKFYNSGHVLCSLYPEIKYTYNFTLNLLITVRFLYFSLNSRLQRSGFPHRFKLSSINQLFVSLTISAYNTNSLSTSFLDPSARRVPCKRTGHVFY